MRTPEDELRELDSHDLLRGLRVVSSPRHPHLRVERREVLNFASNDYLGLAQHPTLTEAAIRATKDYGTGSTASRLICGSLDIFHELEEHLATVKQAEAALTFANGFATATGTIPALVGRGDTIILDKLSHACLIDAARLSGATLRVFPHNDLNKLEKLLISGKGRSLVITESVFSMGGDLCPLEKIVALKEQHGALLLLDEAHATGVLGPNGYGLAEELGLQDRIDFQMGTLGKALGSAGGYFAASRQWIDLLINKARSFIYSTAPPPSQAAASLAALRLLRTNEGQSLRDKLKANLSIFRSQILDLESPPPIIPHVVGDNATALATSRALFEQGFLVPAVRYPTVPKNTARLRITLTAAHQREQIEDLRNAINSLKS